MARSLSAAAASALAAVTICACAIEPAIAQAYPARPVRVIVPQPPGGGTDIVGRVISDQVGRQLGQQFFVENRTGGGTVVGTDAAAAPHKEKTATPCGAGKSRAPGRSD